MSHQALLYHFFSFLFMLDIIMLTFCSHLSKLGMEGIFLRSRNLRINLYEMYFERQIFNKNSLINFLMIFHYVFSSLFILMS